MRGPTGTLMGGNTTHRLWHTDSKQLSRSMALPRNKKGGPKAGSLGSLSAPG